jgi:acetolactate synthase-1/2/3 large subunit
VSDIDQLAEGIARHGVRQVFGITGSGPSLSLLHALDRLGVTFHGTYFEGSAAVMAATIGRLSGRAGVALSIKGPGLANMVPGLAAAHLEAWPMIALAEAYGPSSDPAKAHKRMNQGLLFGGVGKGSRYLDKGGPDFAALAGWAEAEVPGPVLLELVTADAQQKVPEPPDVAGNPDAVLDAIARAKRPVVIAGTMAVRRGWSGRLNGLAIPVFSTAAAKGAVDETLPHAAGVYTGVGLDLVPERHLIAEADLVVGLGLRTNELLGTPGFPCPAVNVDPVGSAASPGLSFVASCGTAEAGLILDALAAAEPWGQDRLQPVLTAMFNAMRSHGFQPPRAFERLSERFNGRARLVLDTGYFCTVGEHAWLARDASWCLGSGQGRYMGIGLPTAIAAALHDSSLPTIAVAGDGGIGMFLAELRLAVRHRLPLLVVLMSDGGFGSVRTRAIKDGLIQSPLLIDDPSWRKVMEAMGLAACEARSEDELVTALEGWDPASGPGYIEVHFEPQGYQAMVKGIR